MPTATARCDWCQAGRPDTSSRFLDATPDGKSVFFSTNDPIVATDTDEETDVYVTRVGAGYPYTAPAEPAVCTGSDCRDQAVAPAPVAVAGRSPFPGAGDPSARPVRSRALGAKVSVAKVKAVKGSVAMLSVKVPSKGRLRAGGSGLVTVSRSASKAGSYRIRMALTATPGGRWRVVGRSPGR